MAWRSEIQRQLSSKLTLHNHPRNILLDDSDNSNQFLLPSLNSLSSTRVYYYSSGEIHTMIKVLVDLHDKNISLSTLDSSNVVRDREGKLMFRGLDFIDSSPESRKNDFMLLARLIEDSLWFPIEWLPIDGDGVIGKDLIERMRDYSNDSDRDLLLNHVAFKSVEEQLSFVTKAFDKGFLLIGDDQKKYKQVLKDMDAIFTDPVKDWRQDIRKSKEKGVKNCFEFQPKAIPVSYEDDTFSKLRFCRNLATHLPQYLRKTVHNNKILSETCRIIFKLFGKELLTFQKLAHKEGILKHFMPGYTSSTPTTQTQGQDYSRSDIGGGGGRQGTHQYRTPGRSRVVAEPNGYIKGG